MHVTVLQEEFARSGCKNPWFFLCNGWGIARAKFIDTGLGLFKIEGREAVHCAANVPSFITAHVSEREAIDHLAVLSQ